MGIHIRAAKAEDLPVATRVGLTAEGEDPGSVVDVPSVMPHIMRTGRLLIAEQGRDTVGFGSAFTRAGVTFLAQLFILPGHQSGGIGHTLLRALMPDEGSIRATISSGDPRAASLYIRHGMRPLWPMYDLSAAVPNLRLSGRVAVEAVPAEMSDPEIVRADAEIGGRARPEDHAYWLEQRGGVPLWFERGGQRVGYGYIQVLARSSDAALESASVRIGPLGTYDTSDAPDCLLAAIELAREHGARLRILVPGPHPALRTLFEMGFRIGDLEAFLTSADPTFVDSRRYIPSGGGLY